jgi:hypothetical protein
MKLCFSTFLAAIGVNILDFDYLWHVLDHFDNSIQLINVHHVNNFLTKKLTQSAINLPL